MGVYYGQRYEAVLAAVDYDDIQNIPEGIRCFNIILYIYLSIS